MHTTQMMRQLKTKKLELNHNITIWSSIFYLSMEINYDKQMCSNMTCFDTKHWSLKGIRAKIC